MPNHFTKEGLKHLTSLAEKQEKKVRDTGAEAGEEAGISCDWHDNFGYEEAKRQLELESKRLGDLREEIRQAVIININDQTDRVQIGNTVKLYWDDEEKEITIGAYRESDPGNGLVAYNSPLARALLGMQAEDAKTVTIAGKKVEIEVEEILPPSFKYHTLRAALFEDSQE